MRKLLVGVLIFFSFGIWIDPSSQRNLSWDKEVVKRCIKATTIVLVNVEDGQFLGTGVMIDRFGLSLTAAHVVGHDGIEQMLMITPEGNRYDVEVLAINRRTDLALIRPLKSAQHFQYSRVQSSEKVFSGQDILVVGHPYSNFYTVTTGIISKVYYNIWYGGQVLDITALVNPGNSGGPIFNARGEVVGIVSAMHISGRGSPTGIGIGVSVRTIHKFLREYAKTAIPKPQIKRYRIGDLK